jgi:hypothetical protein
MTANKEKQFDCLKMKSTIQAQIYSETQDMSPQELLDYFNQQPGPGKFVPSSQTALPRMADFSHPSFLSH